jgi:hypothetical protein
MGQPDIACNPLTNLARAATNRDYDVGNEGPFPPAEV